MTDTSKLLTAVVANGLLAALTDAQTQSITAIVNEADKQGATKPQLAYLLATSYHECFNPRLPETRLTPMVEFGGETYLKGKAYYPYYGHGFSQLTWKANYEKEGKRMGLDLLSHPELMLQIPTAANSHVYCMLNGTYTGKKLSDYVGVKVNFVDARRVVNGKDKADLIASYAQRFLVALG